MTKTGCFTVRTNRRPAPPRGLAGLGVAFLAGIILLTSVMLRAQAPSPPPERGGIDWIFVIDTSGSMRGAGGTQDIFDAVKRAVGEFINTARQGDSVTIHTFARDTDTRPTVRVTDETDKRDLMRAVDRMKADGDRTHTGKALRDALTRASELGGRPGSGSRKIAIVLLTDGLEDVRGIPNPVPIPATIDLVPDSQPFMFFVSLGAKKETAVEDAFAGHPKLAGFRTIDQPSREALAQLADTIRPVVEAAATPTPQPIRVTLEVSPTKVDFGEVEPGDESEERTVQLTSTHDARVQVTLEPAVGITLLAPTEPVAVTANVAATIALQLAVEGTTQDGVHSTTVTVRPVGIPQDAVVTSAVLVANVDVVRQPPWRKALRWLAALLIALVLALAAFSIARGEAFWTTSRKFRERKQLEGEIELIRPRPAANEETHVSLTSLRRERAQLSAVIPAMAEGDSDGELFTESRRGIKYVRVRCTRGTVRVNGGDVSTADLYDGHLIEVGVARVRFHWLGHEEPTVDGES